MPGPKPYYYGARLEWALVSCSFLHLYVTGHAPLSASVEPLDP